MKSKIALVLLITSLSLPILAQTAKRKGAVNRKPTVPTPQPSPVAQPPAPARPVQKPVAPTSLVVVNGHTLTTADLQPALRQELEGLEDKIAEARSNVLDLQINTMLLQVEAKKRRID